MQASLISQITSDGISTVPYETIVSAQKSRAPFHNGITVGCCWGQKANSLAQLSIRENILICITIRINQLMKILAGAGYSCQHFFEN